MKWICMALALAGCARSTAAGHDRDLSVAGADPGDGTGGNGGADLGGTGGGGGGGGGAGAGGSGGGGGAGAGGGSGGGGGASDDLAMPAPPDLATPLDLATPPDLTPSSSDVYVHVLIDNFCNSSTNPTVINAPLHVPLVLTFHNDSVDYHADVWSSRGYGYLDLVTGGTWKDPVQHCLNPTPYTEYFDVGIQGGPVGGACPNYRLYIHCN